MKRYAHDHFPTDLTFYLELALEVLLAFTLCYCVILERRLAAVRKGQEGLSRTIGELNMAISGAGASLRALKAAAGEAAQTLDERLKRARLHIDELSVLTVSGERIAQRMEGAASTPRVAKEIPDMPLPSTSILSRLERAVARRTLSNPKRTPPFARLLPSVVALGAVVFDLKTTDLVHHAYSQASSQVAALTSDPIPANKDYAGGEDDQVASASEVDVVNSLSKRRRELDARDAQLAIQANMIAAAEARVDAKIAQLKQLHDQINALLVQHDDAQKAQIASLVKTYSTMKAKDAARIFNSLPDEVLVPVAHDMKSDILALVMANMNSENAKALTVKLANKLALPQTADAMAPAPAAGRLPKNRPWHSPEAKAACRPLAAPAAATAAPTAATVTPENTTPPKG